MWIVGFSLKVEGAATREFPNLWCWGSQLIAKVPVLIRFGRPLYSSEVFLFAIRHLPSVVSRAPMQRLVSLVLEIFNLSCGKMAHRLKTHYSNQYFRKPGEHMLAGDNLYNCPKGKVDIPSLPFLWMLAIPSENINLFISLLRKCYVIKETTGSSMKKGTTNLGENGHL